MIDEDGSLTGEEPGSKVLAYSPIYNPQLCREATQWSARHDGVICSPESKFALFGYNHVTSYESLFQQDIYLETEFGGHRVGFRGQTGGLLIKGWFAIVPTGTMNKISYPDFPAITDFFYNAKVWELDVSIYRCTHTHI